LENRERKPFQLLAAHGTSESEYEAKELDKEIIIKNFPETKKKFIGKTKQLSSATSFFSQLVQIFPV
jgi:hypothetical protein